MCCPFFFSDTNFVFIPRDPFHLFWDSLNAYSQSLLFFLAKFSFGSDILLQQIEFEMFGSQTPSSVKFVLVSLHVCPLCTSKVNVKTSFSKKPFERWL